MPHNKGTGIIADTLQKEKLTEASGNQTWIKDAPVIIAACANVAWDIAEQPEDDFGKTVNYVRFGKDFIHYLCTYPDRKACMALFENASPFIPMKHICLTAVS